jgi:YfiH family protein
MMIESELLRAAEPGGVRHGFFTREGGVSEGLYASLNCGLGSGDAQDAVRENRAGVTARLGAQPGNLVTARQVHSPRAIVAEAPWPADAPPEADAIVTRTPGLIVGALSADCAPVLFADSEARIVAAAHAGWRGALTGVIESTLATMEELGASRARIRAVVGPAIGRNAYEVGVDFASRFLDDDAASQAFFTRGKDDAHVHFDLAGYCLKRLEAAGVVHRQVVDLCTYSHESHFFSYRRSVHREERDYGRQISAIVVL